MRGGGHEHNLNTRGAFLHVIGDMLGSVGAIVAALIMLLPDWYLAAPLLSAGIGLLILYAVPLVVTVAYWVSRSAQLGARKTNGGSYNKETNPNAQLSTDVIDKSGGCGYPVRAWWCKRCRTWD